MTQEGIAFGSYGWKTFRVHPGNLKHNNQFNFRSSNNLRVLKIMTSHPDISFFNFHEILMFERYDDIPFLLHRKLALCLQPKLENKGAI